MATTEEEASQFEKDLYKLSRQLKLERRLVKEEPPSQLYATVFGGKDRGDGGLLSESGNIDDQ